MALRNVKWCGHCRKVWQFLKRLNTEYRVRPINFTPRYIPGRTENRYSNKYADKHLRSSIIHNSQQVGTVKMSINDEWINKL